MKYVSKEEVSKAIKIKQMELKLQREIEEKKFISERELQREIEREKILLEGDRLAFEMEGRQRDREAQG